MTVLGSLYRNTFDMDHSDTNAAEFFARVVKLVPGFWRVEFFMTGSQELKQAPVPQPHFRAPLTRPLRTPVAPDADCNQMV